MTNFAIFVAATGAIVAVPGPNHLYITTHSIGAGRRAGIASALGVETGTLVHIVAAAAGLSALIAASATAFNVVRYAGAGYLIYLGIRTLLKRGEDDHEQAIRPQRLSRVYLEGVVVNIFNPKTILFFLAFLPQFVDQGAGSIPLQVIGLGLVLALIGLTTDVAYAIGAGSLGALLRRSPRFRRGRRYATGIVYLGLGAATAFAGPRRT
ncbi:LysE family translocator [Actinomadura sp. HBU206391]|uniref:LysE family translocator n=1 Tax=Actinomadura sp. HBU206391 TaxID=2731692 RepID=UPI00164EEDB9|nr:LysE family translocator [Actinomadura sp. HBU206391]MBC6462527.1 LysE family translocator [Actinomadura sp. HBU206391]